MLEIIGTLGIKTKHATFPYPTFTLGRPVCNFNMQHNICTYSTYSVTRAFAHGETNKLRRENKINFKVFKLRVIFLMMGGVGGHNGLVPLHPPYHWKPCLLLTNGLSWTQKKCFSWPLYNSKNTNFISYQKLDVHKIIWSKPLPMQPF